MLPKQSTPNISSHTAIFSHLMDAATQIDTIEILYGEQTSTGNFGFPQSIRKRIPLLNIKDPVPPIGTPMTILYHGMAACWGFESRLINLSIDGNWNIVLPTKIVCNDARRAPRYFLSPTQLWSFSSSQGLGNLQLRDLSTLGMSFVYDTRHFALRKGERLRGILELEPFQLPIIAQVRHTERDISDKKQTIAGCSFEKISDWSRLKIQNALQELPFSIHRRIQ